MITIAIVTLISIIIGLVINNKADNTFAKNNYEAQEHISKFIDKMNNEW